MAGGGYFRFFPGPVFRKGVRSILDREGVYSFYMHPWEIDPGQPRVAAASPWFVSATISTWTAPRPASSLCFAISGMRNSFPAGPMSSGSPIRLRKRMGDEPERRFLRASAGRHPSGPGRFRGRPIRSDRGGRRHPRHHDGAGGGPTGPLRSASGAGRFRRPDQRRPFAHSPRRIALSPVPGSGAASGLGEGSAAGSCAIFRD
jgi:hypothetical protein